MDPLQMASAPEAVSEKEQERRRSDNNDHETEVLFAKEAPPEEDVAGGGENEVGHEKVSCFFNSSIRSPLFQS